MKVGEAFAKSIFMFKKATGSAPRGPADRGGGKVGASMLGPRSVYRGFICSPGPIGAPEGYMLNGRLAVVSCG